MADSPEVKKEKLSSMSAAVKRVIDEYAIGHKFYGNELHDDVSRIYPDAKNMYPDTILKMARRHRRDSYICIDHNNSLYKRVESTFEKELRITREKQEEEERKKQEDKKRFASDNYSLFSQGLFAFFLVVFLGAAFVLGSLLGAPLLPPSFIAFQSSSVHKPVTPIKSYGVLPALSNRLEIAAEDTDLPILINRSAITKTVNGLFIPQSIYEENHNNQVQNVKMSLIFDILLHIRIVKNQKICKFSENSFQKLDKAIGRVYSNRIYVFN